jgi:hypothetical protein
MWASRDARSRTKIEKLLKKEITDRDVEELLNIVLKSKPVAKLRKHMVELSTQAAELASCVRNETIAPLLKRLAESTLEDL